MASRKQDRFVKVPDWFSEPSQRFSSVSVVVQKDYDSIVAAQTYAETLNVRVEFGEKLTVANMVNEFLTQLMERGMTLPQEVIVNANPFRDYEQNKVRFIAAKTVDRTIYINPSSVVWVNPVQAAAQMYEGRFWSTPHPLHPFFHEEGHILLGTAGRPRPLSAKQANVAASVSTYAKGNQEELVCEMLAGLFCEVEYDADMMRLYKRLGGKTI